MNKRIVKAVSLLSGGLDSILATRLILEQGIEVVGLNVLTPFNTGSPKGNTCLAAQKAASQLGIPLKVFEVSREYMEVVRYPKFGYGSNMNPCIDCRILMLKKGALFMKRIGASFLVTGEVLGERPMSQRRDTIMLIEREAGLEGLIVRPLSARLFGPSIPEKEGLLNRDKFLQIKGRSRKPQIKLAQELGIRDYSSPAGGCLLTDPGFSKKLKDLMDHSELTLRDIHLLKVGRHFRLCPRCKVVVGRNKDENERLLSMVEDGDVVFDVVGYPSPIAVARGDLNSASLELSARIVARYGDGNGKMSDVSYRRVPQGQIDLLRVDAISEVELQKYRI